MAIDLLNSEGIASDSRLRLLGKRTLVFDRVSSTNDVAIEQAAGGAPEGLLVIADEQSAGRGRLGRSWIAPAGSALLFSLLFRPPLPAHLAGQVTMCVGLGAIEGVEEVTELRPSLKWPNDLLLGGLKLGGMLSELELSGEGLSHVVVGLGINVNLDTSSTQEAWVRSATSLLMGLGRPIDRLSLLRSILARTEYWYERLLLEVAGEHTGARVYEEWSRRLDTLGRRVEITLASGQLRGVALAVSPGGALEVRTDEGRLVEVWTGDVRALRSDSAEKNVTG